MNILKNKFPGTLERIAGLGELAYNLWWSWNPSARMLFKMLDRQAWKESVHNPIKMLKELPKEVLESAVKNPEYLRHYDIVINKFRKEMQTKKGWFSENVANPKHLTIAYFSAEYGLHHSLPFYAGGLGFLSGDHLKESSDLNIPLVAVGFMYPEGYFRQNIRADGWQENVDEILDRQAAPITKVPDKSGKHLIVKVPFIEPPIYVAVWTVAVGRIPLYLMDTDIEMNAPWNREISAHLYVGDTELRLRQEIVLGIGGKEVLNALGIKHTVLHLNEGHPAFVILENIRENVRKGLDYESATQQVRATTVFTTHTPVPAGHDIFPFNLMDKYFNHYYPLLGLSHGAFHNLGIHPENPSKGFNMTAFALRMSAYHNGVSKKHGEVARGMWHSLWPDKTDSDVPIDSITNGVHVPTWIDPKMVLLFNKYLGVDWIKDHDNSILYDLIDNIPDEELWQVHFLLKMKLFNFIRDRARRRWVNNKVVSPNILIGGALLDPMALTIGFARRFATYKRAELIFHDLDRVKKMLHNRCKPVQFIFAGKAHPADDSGKQILQKIFNYAKDPELNGRIAFVENYDEQLSQYMVHGVDIWLNNPLPPKEASGTSGMKAGLNGVPSLSIMDGWWIEGFNGRNGWAFGEDKVVDDRNATDAEALYNLLENNIIPLYYNVTCDGIPKGWIKVMKESIKSIAPKFSARQMVKKYVTNYYCNCFEGIHSEGDKIQNNVKIKDV